MASAGEIRAGAAYVELVLRDKLQAQLAAAGEKLRKFAGSVHNLGMKAFGGSLPGPIGELLRMAASPAGAMAGFTAASKVWAEAGHELERLSKKTGLSVEELSRLKYAADQVGVPIETVATGMNRLQRSLVEAASGAAAPNEALARLGLTIQDFAGKTPHEQLMMVAEGLSRIQDPAIRSAAGMALMGRGAGELFPLLALGREGIGELVDEAEDLELVMSGPAAAAAAKLHSKFKLLTTSLSSLVKAIGAAVGAFQGQLLDKLIAIILCVRDFIKKNKELVVTIAKVASLAVGGGAALVVLGGALSVVATIFTAFATAATFAATALAFLMGTIPGLIILTGLLATGVIGAVLGLGRMRDMAAGVWGWIKTRAIAAFETIREAVGAIWNALAGGKYKLALDVITTGLFALWEKVKLKASAAWIDIRDGALNTLTGIWDSMAEAGDKAWGWISKAWLDLKDSILGGISEILIKLYAGLLKVADGIKTVFTEAIISIRENLPWGVPGAMSATDAASARAANKPASPDELNRQAKETFGRKGEINPETGEQETADETLKRKKEKIDADLEAKYGDGNTKEIEDMKRNEKQDAQKQLDLEEQKGKAEDAAQAYRDAVKKATGVAPRDIRVVARPKPGTEFSLPVDMQFASVGSFSKDAIVAMGRGGGPAERLVGLSEKQLGVLSLLSGELVGKGIGKASNEIAKGVKALTGLLSFK